MRKRAKKSITITDVAKDCGISTATVSRVLNNHGYPVSEKTRQTVLESARKLGYIPNLIGKMLKQNYNPSVGIIVPSLQNSFFVQLINAISQEALSMDFTPHIFCSQRNVQYERTAIRQFIEQQIKILLIESIDKSSKYIQEFVNNGGKVCIFSSNSDTPFRGIVNATPNMVTTGEMAIEYLYSKGHREIAIISSPLTKKNRIETLKGVINAATKLNLPFNQDTDLFIASHEEELESGQYEFKTGEELANRITSSKKKYTAILAFNDLLAIGAIHFFTKAGWSIPNDISIMGIDDIPASSFITPSLTTVNMASEFLGKSACRLLINSLKNNESDYALDIQIIPRVQVRDSVKQLI